MSRIGLCNRGGLDGIKVETSELKRFAKEHGLKFIDLVIPLPGDGQMPLDKCPHRNRATEDHEGVEHTMYWETETGSHGWCCSVCGEVTQWG